MGLFGLRAVGVFGSLCGLWCDVRLCTLRQTGSAVTWPTWPPDLICPSPPPQPPVPPQDGGVQFACCRDSCAAICRSRSSLYMSMNISSLVSMSSTCRKWTSWWECNHNATRKRTNSPQNLVGLNLAMIQISICEPLVFGFFILCLDVKTTGYYDYDLKQKIL